MATAKPKAKKGKKVTKGLEGVNVAMGRKKAPTKSGEVTGHMSPYPGAYYYCWGDGALNWVPGGLTFFICWNDGCINRV